jgi:hypothetical protein
MYLLFLTSVLRGRTLFILGSKVKVTITINIIFYRLMIYVDGQYGPSRDGRIKKGALDSQVIKFSLPVIGGSLRLLPPLKLDAIIQLKYC